jgi:hypothetical protein
MPRDLSKFASFSFHLIVNMLFQFNFQCWLCGSMLARNNRHIGSKTTILVWKTEVRIFWRYYHKKYIWKGRNSGFQIVRFWLPNKHPVICYLCIAVLNIIISTLSLRFPKFYLWRSVTFYLWILMWALSLLILWNCFMQIRHLKSELKTTRVGSSNVPAPDFVATVVKVGGWPEHKILLA